MPHSADRSAEPHVLRLCSVFEPAGLIDGELDHGAARFDPIGGMQNHTAALTRCLDAHGLTQTVVTSRLAGPTGVSRLGRRTRIQRTGLPTARFRQLWALSALPAVLRTPPGGRVDVVHAHQGEDIATLLLARLAARRHRCPLVVSVHCSVGHTLRGRSPRARLLHTVGGAVERSTLRRAEAVIVLTARTARALADDGVAAERVSTIPSGFDPALFGGHGSDVFPEAGRPRIGYVGRLAEQKRADVLVHAFGRMAEEAALVVVGDGPERERVRQLVRASPVAERITMTGFVDHSAVPGVLASLDVLVLPSAYEEMGSVLVEAMAAGLPVVASDVGGIPEVVRDGETGLLVPPGDVDALAGALDRLVADGRLRSRLAAGARIRARAYGWPYLSGCVAEVYQRVRAPDPLLARPA
ncbi:glycosyltransferase [Blastococcus saxobsidens]|uniref:Glycosyltransferase n=1 Tax=Blastococcus saxobsidens (strain DD2) TaxID=1146883 RepID=H6RLN3_BLASD|nr:glycosyltransferase [Blastococcus saxobsidens]CCG03759.1 Glycosyltransferase [Blastococcus saxobsidens DD2]